jgi:hypothetical protein
MVLITRVRIYDRNVKPDGGAVRRGPPIASPGPRVRIISIAIAAMNNYYQNKVRAASR